MPFYFPKHNNRGQHIVEYVLLSTLVMAGILVMGPYVIRSWNAHVKSYEDSFTDSMGDPLLQGDISAVPCTCSDDTPVSCGSDSGADPRYGGAHLPDTAQTDNGCGCNERLIARTCAFPDGTAGCDYESRCDQDNGCCCRQPIGGCEASADLNCDFDRDGTADCGTDERCFAFTCGTSTAVSFYRCENDITCYACAGFIPDPAVWQMCPGDDQDLPYDNYPLSVQPAGGCSDPTKCEVTCTPPLIPMHQGDPSCMTTRPASQYRYYRELSQNQDECNRANGSRYPWGVCTTWHQNNGNDPDRDSCIGSNKYCGGIDGRPCDPNTEPVCCEIKSQSSNNKKSSYSCSLYYTSGTLTYKYEKYISGNDCEPGYPRGVCTFWHQNNPGPCSQGNSTRCGRATDGRYCDPATEPRCCEIQSGTNNNDMSYDCVQLTASSGTPACDACDCMPRYEVQQSPNPMYSWWPPGNKNPCGCAVGFLENGFTTYQ